MTARIIDTPHPQVGDMQREHIPLDIDGCNVASIVMALNEFDLPKVNEGKIGHRMESWPADICVRMEKQIGEWLARNPKTSVKGFTQGISDGCCVIAIHWRPKS